MCCIKEQLLGLMKCTSGCAPLSCCKSFCCSDRASGAPMMKKTAKIGKFEYKGELYTRFVKHGPVYRLIPSTTSIDINGNVKEPQFTLKEVSPDCCESVLAGRPEPIKVSALPAEYFAIGTIPVGSEPSTVLGVGFRDNNGTSFHTAEHNLVASTGGMRIFKKFGGKYVDIVDNVTFKRGSDSNPNIKGTGWDHVVFTFKDEKELIKTCADLGIGKAKRYNKKSSGFFEMFGATDEGFWKTKGSLLPQSSASKIMGVSQHNASSFGGFSGALLRSPGTGEGIGMHICGFKAFNCSITVPALTAHEPPLNTMEDILNSVNESTVYGEDQTGFQIDMERVAIEEAQIALEEELTQAFDDQIADWGIQGSTRAPDNNRFRKRWADYEPDDEADLLLLEARIKEKRARKLKSIKRDADWVNDNSGDESAKLALKPPGLGTMTTQVVIEPLPTLRERVGVDLLRNECTRNIRLPKDTVRRELFVKNEAAVSNDDLTPQVSTAECCMMGAALQDDTKRFWSNFEGDVPPQEPPMQFTGETIDNERFKDLVKDFLYGGRKAAKAQLVMNKCFPDAKSGKERVIRLLNLDFVKNEIGPYTAALAFTKVGENATVHNDKNGEAFFREVGSYKSMIPKNAKNSKDTCFDETWRTKLQEGGFGSLSDDIIPANTKQNILDSMFSQSARQNRTSPKLTQAALAAFIKCSETYTPTVPPLYSEERTTADLPAGWERVLSNLQDKSSGYSNRYRCASKSAWALKHSQELRKLVAIRMLLRSAAGASMATMSPLEMFDLFLADPKEIFLKAEGHSGAKRRGKRWRMIWISSVIDAVCQALISLNQNKRDIFDYQIGAKTVHGSGAGHHDAGIKLLMQQIGAFAGDLPVKSSDASGWDLSVSRLALLLDGERRSQNVVDFLSFYGPDNDQEMKLAASLSFYTDAFANSAHSLAFKGMVFVCCKYGITATGTPNTTSQNSFMRSFILFVAGADWALSVGDDENHIGDVDQDILAEWGVITKDDSEGEGFADDFAMLSHDYKKSSCGRCYAEYTNVNKMISTNALKLARGEPIHPQVVGGQLYVLRDSCDATETYKKAAALCGWSVDVDKELIRYDEELVYQL